MSGGERGSLRMGLREEETQRGESGDDCALAGRQRAQRISCAQRKAWCHIALCRESPHPYAPHRAPVLRYVGIRADVQKK
jgi:hypothetical protein